MQRPDRRHVLDHRDGPALTDDVGAFVAIADGVTEGVAVKDLYRVDGLPTRAGTSLPPAVFDRPESEVVRRLRVEGHAVLGKTAMDELAYCEPPATTNPLDRRRTPGGSSGGSAAAVAAGMCELALGSQTLQSTIVPAAYCGVVGFKPTYERVPFDGVPLAPSFDTVGLLTPTVDALAAAMPAVDPTWSAEPPRPVRLGLPEPWGPAAQADAWSRLDRHLARVAGPDVTVVPCRVPWNDDILDWAVVVHDLVHGELARVLGTLFAEHGDALRPRTREAFARGAAVTDERLATCGRRQVEVSAAIDEVLVDRDLDGFVSPAVAGVAPIGYEITGDSWITSFWSLTRLPCLTIPVRDADETMPRGVQLTGRRNGDEALVALASVLESRLKA